jgi:hypothetical protein
MKQKFKFLKGRRLICMCGRAPQHNIRQNSNFKRNCVFCGQKSKQIRRKKISNKLCRVFELEKIFKK